ncbi:MAG: tetratricopeptide repeat protein [Acidobacteria bacterium]|nr:tetratricopeptide repeat protein [Acidobacteriota bacterium]
MRRSVPVFLALLIILSWACHKKVAVNPPPRIPDTPAPKTDSASLPEKPPSVQTKTVPSSPAVTITPLSRLEMGEIHFRQGKYPEAVRNYEAFLKSNPGDESTDRILFNLGLSHALSPGSDRNLPGAKTTLNRLLTEYPYSGYKSQAELILSLITQVERLTLDIREQDSRIQQLQEELNRLKEIDLKRRPSRPKEQ